MKFSQYCEQAENTEQEQKLLNFFKQENMNIVEKIFAKFSCVPIMGKIFAALNAMGNYESIVAFKQSEHYQNIKNWNFKINYDKKTLYITPTDEQRRKALKIFALIGIIISLVVICRKMGCYRKNP